MDPFIIQQMRAAGLPEDSIELFRRHLAVTTDAESRSHIASQDVSAAAKVPHQVSAAATIALRPATKTKDPAATPGPSTAPCPSTAPLPAIVPLLSTIPLPPTAPLPSTAPAPPAEEGFQPAKTRKRTRTANESPREAKKLLNPSNRFAALDEMEVEDPTTAPEKTKAPPPVILRAPEKWTTVAARMSEKRLAFTKAKTISAGILIQPTNPDAHRGITKMLDDMALPYHTYALQEEKPLKVVIRGLPTFITDDEVEESLRHQGFDVEGARRMKKKDGSKMPLVFVNLRRAPKTKDIFGIRTCCDLNIQVESPNKKRSIGQCFRCQKFHHSQRCCRAEVKCVKCAGDHRAADCQRPRDAAATCVNCGGPHPASYRGCPKFPQLPKSAPKPTSAPTAAAAPPTPAACPVAPPTVRPGVSYARATAPAVPEVCGPAHLGGMNPAASTKEDSPLEQILKLLQKINFDRLVPVIQKVSAALAGKTTMPEVLTAVLSCAQDIASLFN